MASVKKCDRCGKYFDRNEIERIGINYPHKVPLARIAVQSVSCGHTDEYDLCDECWEKFFAWMDEWNVDEEVEPVPYIEQDTKCDTCEYLPKCVQEGNVMESYNVCDMKIHHVRRRGDKCIKEVLDNGTS